MGYRGLFVGLTTLDLIYNVPGLSFPNQKQTATDLAIAAGGPATNAAVLFRHLGNEAILLSGIGQHPITTLLRSDLCTQQVQTIDLLPDRADAPPLSSITVVQETGERAVVCRNALQWQASVSQIPPNSLHGVEIILLDGHQLEVSVAIAQAAQQQNIPVVLDGGSWKPGLETLLPFINYALCSADFYPPNCTTPSEVIHYLQTAIAQPNIAITQGAEPIQYVQSQAEGQVSTGQIPIPSIIPTDTLGAGDFFHGAFCHWILQTHFVEALKQASQMATLACQSFGTRTWLETIHLNHGLIHGTTDPIHKK